MTTPSMPKVFSVAHDSVVVKVGNWNEYTEFPSHWSDSEIEDWVWRHADRRDKRVLRREIRLRSRKPYNNKGFP